MHIIPRAARLDLTSKGGDSSHFPQQRRRRNTIRGAENLKVMGGVLQGRFKGAEKMQHL